MESFDDNEAVSREELLEGRLAPGRKAHAMLYAIENRTAQLVSQSQVATALYLTKKAVEERESAFLDALAAGRDLPVKPTIQDLERYAPYWADLVSEADASLLAALAHALGSKYTFRRESVPSIRKALGLDQDDVQRVYERLYKESLSGIYTPKISWRDRVRWTQSRFSTWLENLPPFWVALVLTIPIGSGLLALPIAIADVGPLAGILFLIFFGLFNALTAAALAESVVRSGTTRFGLGYLGQLVAEYLGVAGSRLLTIVMALDSFFVLIVFYLGTASTLSGATRLPAALWVLGIFLVGLYFLSRRSLNSTVASTLVVTTLNVCLVVIIPLFALPYVKPANLTYVNIPFVGEQPFNPSSFLLIFGVMLNNYCSHLMVANYGKVVIRRDPSARSWIWGVIAAIGLTTLISCWWVVLFNGALSPQVLASQTSTALTALAELVGPVVNWLGSLCVVLSLGMGSIHTSLGLLYLMEERLPALTQDQLNKRGHFLLSISPVLAAFLAAEWLSITGQGSFTGLLSFIGVFSLPLMGGVYPVLLLAATRRKGDFVPGLVLRVLGNPIILVGTYLLFVGGIFVYGLFIYEGVVERIVILLVGVGVLAVTAVMLRSGALRKRMVIVLQEDQTLTGTSVISLTANGQPAKAEVCQIIATGQGEVQPVTGQIPISLGLHSASIRFPVTRASELKTWVHRITPEWRSESLPAFLSLECGSETKEFVLALHEGQISLPITGEACEIKITLTEHPIDKNNIDNQKKAG